MHLLLADCATHCLVQVFCVEFLALTAVHHFVLFSLVIFSNSVKSISVFHGLHTGLAQTAH